MPTHNPKTTALVMIDLQQGLVSMSLAPLSGDQVAQAGTELAQCIRAAGALVAAVQVGWSSDLTDMPPQNVDRRIPLPEGGFDSRIQGEDIRLKGNAVDNCDDIDDTRGRPVNLSTVPWPPLCAESPL